MKIQAAITVLSAFAISALAAPTSVSTAIEARGTAELVVRPIDCDKDGEIVCLGKYSYSVCDHGKTVPFDLPMGDNRCAAGSGFNLGGH